MRIAATPASPRGLPVRVLWFLLILSPLPELTHASGEPGRQPSVEWTFSCGSPVYSSPAAADLTASPGLEILLISSSERKVFCLTSSGEVLWTWGSFSLRVTCTPSVADLDGDSHPEILIATRTDGVVCLSATGEEVWRRPTHGGIPWGNATVADTDLDGRFEVLWVTEKGWVECVGADGGPLWSFQTEQGISLGPLSAGDLDGDGLLEAVAQGGPVVYALGREGKELWRFEGGARFNTGSVIAKLTGDTAPVVLTASNDGVLYCLDGASGRPLWTHRTFEGRVDTTLAVGDIDGIPGQEIIYGDGKGNLYALARDGTERWHHRAGDWIESAPVLGDVDGDLSVEVILGTGEGLVQCLDPQGRLEWTFNTGKRVSASPTLCDCDQDGILEILVASHNGTFFCLSLGGAWEPSRIPWPSKRLDLSQTANSTSRHEP